jgi:hypothetical protein
MHACPARREAGHRNFLVDYKFVRLIVHHGKSTCFSVAADPGTPSAEVVASALLHANGKVFRDAYQLTRDET